MPEPKPRIAIACQGGGTHAAFEAGALTAILNEIQRGERFELVGLSGTSAGALCALMVWYGLAPRKNGAGSGSPAEAIRQLNAFWDAFAATTPAEVMHNALCGAMLSAQEQEVPVLGINMPVAGLNPRGIVDDVILWELGQLGARREYYDFDAMLAAACPDFDAIDWPAVRTRVLVGASEIVGGVETVFDSDCNVAPAAGRHVPRSVDSPWRRRLPLSLRGVAASGTLPSVREAEEIDGGHYWDGLYSQNPPLREFLSGIGRDHVPDEIWVLRINPQRAFGVPRTSAEVRDRENELMGNLSLHKELDFVLTINAMIERYGGGLAADYKPVTVRTIKMREATAARLRTASKFNRSRSLIDDLRAEGEAVAAEWLAAWPSADPARRYPLDAAY